MSKTVKTTIVYPYIFRLSCFPLYQYAARPKTEPYRTAKRPGTYRFINISTQPYCVLRTALFWPRVLSTAIFRPRVLRTV